MSNLILPQLDVEDIAIKMDMLDTSTMSLEATEHLDTELKMYTRELFIPTGNIVIGKQHKKACLNIITKGRLLVKTSMEDEGREIVVPHNMSQTFVTEAGSRKIVYALEDTIVINIWSNVESTSLDTIEDELVIPSLKYKAYLKEKESKWLGE